jgi:hypothetical protein
MGRPLMGSFPMGAPMAASAAASTSARCSRSHCAWAPPPHAAVNASLVLWGWFAQVAMSPDPGPDPPPPPDPAGARMFAARLMASARSLAALAASSAPFLMEANRASNLLRLSSLSAPTLS